MDEKAPEDRREREIETPDERSNQESDAGVWEPPETPPEPEPAEPTGGGDDDDWDPRRHEPRLR